MTAMIARLVVQLQLDLLLRPWIRCFVIVIPAWWNLTDSKLRELKAKLNRKKTQIQRLLLSESGFVLCRVPSWLSLGRRIKTIISSTLWFADYNAVFL